jgi:hypothetical protein
MVSFIKVVLFAILFLVSTNLQILAQVEKNKRDKNIAVILSVIGAVLLGVIVCV